MDVRRAPLLTLLCIGLALSSAAPASGQDFDPRGRHHPTPGPTPRSGGGRRPTTPSGGAPGRAPGRPASPGGTATTATAPGATGSAEPRGTSAAVLLERYTRVALAQPGAPFPLQRLAQLYREKDGSLANLVADFEKRAAAAGTEQYAATITLA